MGRTTASALDSTSSSVSRDLAYEEVFLDEVIKEAARRANIDATLFAQAVAGRLAFGAERYGDTFRTDGRNMLSEVLDKAPDVCAYSLLELESLGDNAPDGVHHHLFEACVHAAIAEAHARVAKAALRAG